MTIYSPRNYRKIYEKHYGPIPKDSNGRSYEIHHIDGNHNNNHISNLKLVSLKEHFKIHYSQNDWAACLVMSQRMILPAHLVSQLASLANQNRVRENKHNFIGGKIQKEHNIRRLNDKTHHFLGESNPSTIHSKNKTHHLLKRPDGTSVCSDNVKNGKHATQHKWKCIHCGLEGKNASAGKRWHFNNCKFKTCSV